MSRPQRAPSCSPATVRRTTTCEPIRVQGFRDTPLNDTGRRQAEELAERVAGRWISPRSWASDLSRARETAEIVGARVGLDVATRPAPAGGTPGALGGPAVRRSRARRIPSGYAAWLRAGEEFRFPGGESLREQQDRVAGRARRCARGRGAAGARRLPRRLDPRDAVPLGPARTRRVSHLLGAEHGGGAAVRRLPVAGVRRAVVGDGRGLLRHPAPQGHRRRYTRASHVRSRSGSIRRAGRCADGVSHRSAIFSFYLLHRADDVDVYIVDQRRCDRPHARVRAAHARP